MLAHRAGVVGAALMVVDQLFSRELLSQWIDEGRPSVELFQRRELHPT
jgi:hypothetical protein